jgi:hypothetical protein
MRRVNHVALSPRSDGEGDLNRMHIRLAITVVNTIVAYGYGVHDPAPTLGRKRKQRGPVVAIGPTLLFVHRSPWLFEDPPKNELSEWPKR